MERRTRKSASEAAPQEDTGPLPELPAPMLLPPEPAVTEPAEAGPRYSVRRFFDGAASVLVMAAVAWPFLPPVFESTATLVLRPTDMEGQANYPLAVRQPLDESFILSELDVFRSEAISDAVVNTHRLAFDDEFMSKPGVATKVAGLASGLFGNLVTESIAREDPKVRLVETDRSGGEVTLIGVKEKLLDKMVLRRDRQSYTVRVGFRSNDPEKAAAMTNTLVHAFLASQVERKAQNADAMKGLLKDRIDEAQREADRSSAAVEQFMISSGLIDQGEQIALEAQLRALSDELATAQARLIDAQTRANSLARMQAANTLESAPEVLASPTIQRLNQSLTESMSRLAVMSTESRNILKQAADERDRIVRSARVEADNWVERESRLVSEVARIRRAMVEREKSTLQLEQLRRQASIDAELLNDAHTRAAARAMATGALKPDAEVISQPIAPDKAVFPNVILYGIGSMGLAGLAGAAMNASAIRRDLTRLMKS